VNTAAVLALLEKHVGIRDEPKSLRLSIEEALVEIGGITPIRATEIAGDRESAIAARILELSGTADDSGRTYGLMLVGSASDRVCGSSHPLPSDAPMVTQAKKGREFVSEILNAIRNLSFGEFEVFSGRILRLLGAGVAQETQQSGDQGIDFFGVISVGELKDLPPGFFRLSHDVGVTIVGQAKHRPKDTLYPDTVRELVGSMSLARNETFSKTGIDLFDRIKLTPFGPMVALLFTTGQISSGAEALAHEAGLITMDGYQLAVFLADCAVGLVERDGEKVFSPDAFREWLNVPPVDEMPGDEPDVEK
jgi:hypothetical protein